MDEVTGEVIEPSAIEAMVKAEIDVQVATAKRYPRSLSLFLKDAGTLVTQSEEIAAECTYSTPRDGKRITGPSIRLAEILLSSWGNCSAGSRLVEEGHDHVTVQGVFHDHERNVRISKEVRRRIVRRDGTRYSADGIGNAVNAGASIAIRNAVFAGIPKAIWLGVHRKAMRTALGDEATLGERRTKLVAHFGAMGVSEADICRVVEVEGIEDVDLRKLAELRQIAQAISDGEVSAREAFAPPAAAAADAPPKDGRMDFGAKGKKPAEEPKPTADAPSGQVAPESERREALVALCRSAASVDDEAARGAVSGWLASIGVAVEDLADGRRWPSIEKKAKGLSGDAWAEFAR